MLGTGTVAHRFREMVRLLAAAGRLITHVAGRYRQQIEDLLYRLRHTLAASVELVVPDHQHAGEERDDEDVVEKDTESGVDTEAGNGHDRRDSGSHERNAGGGGSGTHSVDSALEGNVEAVGGVLVLVDRLVPAVHKDKDVISANPEYKVDRQDVQLVEEGNLEDATVQEERERPASIARALAQKRPCESCCGGVWLRACSVRMICSMPMAPMKSVPV